jgi:hypothetical protein
VIVQVTGVVKICQKRRRVNKTAENIKKLSDWLYDFLTTHLLDHHLPWQPSLIRGFWTFFDHDVGYGGPVKKISEPPERGLNYREILEISIIKCMVQIVRTKDTDRSLLQQPPHTYLQSYNSAKVLSLPSFIPIFLPWLNFFLYKFVLDDMLNLNGLTS